MLEFVMNIAPAFFFLVFYVNFSMKGKEAGGAEGSIRLPRFLHRVLFPGAAYNARPLYIVLVTAVSLVCGNSGGVYLFRGGGLGGADGGIPADDRDSDASVSRIGDGCRDPDRPAGKISSSRADPDDPGGPGAAGLAPQTCDFLFPLAPLKENKRSA